RELIERALARWLVGAPAEERGAVPKPPTAQPGRARRRLGIALPVIESDLAHQVRSERQPVHLFLAVAPAALTAPAAAGVVEARPLCVELTVRGQELHQVALLGGLERRREADVVKRAIVAVQTEQQRADGSPNLAAVPAEGADHALGGALMLDLQHHSLAWDVAPIESLGDDAIEPRAFEALEPARGEGAIQRRGGQINGWLRLCK